MTSEIKVDTISEQTSANGVTIDGLTIKDGNIIGDVALAGTTPTFTVGDGGAEDAALIFDGNAVDYYMALDDSADNLIIGSGSTVGSNSLITIDSDGDFTLDSAGDIILDVGGGDIKLTNAGTNVGEINLNSNGGDIQLANKTQDKDITFHCNDGGGIITVLTLDGSAAGAATFNSSVAMTSFAATAASTITTADNSNTLTLSSTDADANPGPVLNYYRNSGSAQDNDYIGRNIFTFNNDAPEIETALAQNIIMTDVSNGSEDVKYVHEQMTAGSIVDRFSISATEAVFNEASIDVNFRVESNSNANMFNVQGSDRVGIGTIADLGAGLHIRLSDSGGTVNGNYDTLVIEESGHSGIEILSGTSSTGLIGFGDSGAALRGYFAYEHTNDRFEFGIAGSEIFRMAGTHCGPQGGKFSTFGEDAPDCGDGGMTLQQGSNDDNIMTFKSTDVAHGMTTLAETDTYATIEKPDSAGGGFFLQSFAEGENNLLVIASSTNEANAKSNSSNGGIDLRGNKKSGTNAGGMGSNANLMVVRNHTDTRFIFDAEGDFHADSSNTTFDEYDDAQLARTFDISHGRGVIESKFDKFISYNHEKLADLRLVGREDDGTPNHFINVTGMQRLHNGAIWQQYEKHQKLASAFYKLAEKTIGKEEADKLLTEEEIQLLN